MSNNELEHEAKLDRLAALVEELQAAAGRLVALLEASIENAPLEDQSGRGADTSITDRRRPLPGGRRRGEE